jgi:uncharacterized damage-inducible protein DinB
MSEIARIVDQLERAHRGDAWHGPSVHKVLDGVDAEAASTRPITNAHTIGELVAHLIAWENEAVARLGGNGKEDLAPEEDWPESEAGWRDLLEQLDVAHERLSAAISECSDDMLDRSLPGRPQATVYVLLHGVIQHNLYHAGQIALLKKAL